MLDEDGLPSANILNLSKKASGLSDGRKNTSGGKTIQMTLPECHDQIDTMTPGNINTEIRHDAQ